MNEALLILSKVFPIVLLIILGNTLQRFSFFRNNTIDELKKFVINIALPALLFLAFTETKFEAKYSLIFIAVFATVYGTTEMFKIALVDIGNGFFFFLILLSYLEKLNGKPMNLKTVVLSFIKSPIILALLAGLSVGSIGAIGVLEANPLTSSLLEMLRLISALVVPVICIVIGYELKIDLKNITEPIKIVLLRMSISLSLAFLINTFVLGMFLQLDNIFKIALYTMFLLPPSFILPIFIESESGKEKQLVLNVLSIHIILSIIVFIAMILFV
ncbi:hypothetical protein HYG86_12340 [Alkalicella caledoniensis]|uniref:Uncharacterized protein n=1 Tax=Alkalicella caledoniensis TaxID=2731377 RepID=A0A7G9W9Y7_ALKCA|nr:hypothetical protein [Alkalicella caledoniensis]QNO15499.1 hypothetical protein HYG86_12340 [Alkalicella caledoniensis]